MTHAEEILLAAVALSQKNTHGVFTRDDVRRFIGVTRTVWLSGYTAIFQGMRIDQPGGVQPSDFQVCSDELHVAGTN